MSTDKDPSRIVFEKFAISQYKNIWLERDDGEYRYSLAATQWLFWQASRQQMLEDAAHVAKTTCHHESTPFADGFNIAALNIEKAIKDLK